MCCITCFDLQVFVFKGCVLKHILFFYVTLQKKYQYEYRANIKFR